jgi:hypothetical protein
MRFEITSDDHILVKAERDRHRAEHGELPRRQAQA